MKVLFPVSECEPFAKTGGLADVGSALPSELVKKDIDIRVIIPFYRKVQDYLTTHSEIPYKKIMEDQEVSFEKFYFGMKKLYSFNVFQSYLPNNPKVIIYFIDIPEFFDRENLYVDEKGNVFPDSAEMFAYFSKAVFEFLNSFNWFPDIIHCHDWHTGLIPLFIKYGLVNIKQSVKTIFSIHNIAYQGSFPKLFAEKFGFTNNTLLMNDLLHNEKINFLKAGIISSDIISTVSETYRDELLTSEYGYGLEDVLEKKKDNFIGILNGVDYEAWDPSKDNLIASKYAPNDLEGKYICKKVLWDLIKKNNKNFVLKDQSIPIFAMVSRLDRQKGVDLVAQAIPELKNLDIHVIVVGSGNKKLEALLVEQSNLPYFTLIRGFSNELAHQVESGADFFIMPSKYEPCGLNQMYSLKYGTFPIVRKTGGLADTVIDLTDEVNGNGFVFDEYSGEELTKAIVRAVNFYNSTEKAKIEKMRSKIMEKNFSWEESVKKYVKLYHHDKV